ncbi:hypothetical protein HMPREF0731_0936, partial [Pseudoroseomonas cervicalis ATCC 49957]
GARGGAGLAAGLLGWAAAASGHDLGLPGGCPGRRADPAPGTWPGLWSGRGAAGPVRAALPL